MTICGTAPGIHGIRTATPTLTAGADTATGDLLYGIPTPGHGAVAVGTDTIHTTEAMVTVLATTMAIGTDTMQARTASTTHTMVAMSSPRPTTPMVA